MSKHQSKRILIDSNKPEKFGEVSRLLDCFSNELEEKNFPFVVLISNKPIDLRSDAQNKLLQCYYTEINKSDWAKGQGFSRANTVIYCKRNIIIDVLKKQATVDSEAGLKALEKISAIRALINQPEEIKLKYLQTDGWSSILDKEHFRDYLKEIELHFLDKINYRLESVNDKLRREAFM